MKAEIKERIEKIKNGKIPDGYAKKYLGIQPKEWIEKRAIEIFKNISDKNHSGDLEVLSVTQDRGVVPRNEVGIDIKYNEESLGNYKKVSIGDFVISLRSFQGGFELSNIEGIASPAYTVFNFKDKEGFNSEYYRYLFKNQTFINRLNTLTYGIRDGKAISFNDFSEMKLSIPSQKEQNKIVEILKKWDEGITKQEELIEAKKKYKKGMMQKIFSQELRFKDENGNDYPKWEEKRLGEIGKIVTGKTPSTEDENLWNGNVQFVTPTDINNFKYQTSTLRTVSDNIKIKILPPNSIMYTCIASIGKMSLSVFPCITNQQINSLIPKNQNNEFIYYALLSITPQIKSTQANTTLPIINKTEFSKFIIPIPSLTEQTQIADFLSSIDREIELLEKGLEILNKEKQSLASLLLNGIVRTILED